jgi:hypothetical protein
LIDPGQEPACVTVCVWPAIVIVPVRTVVFGFAVNVNATVPLPLPLAPLVIVIHDAVVLAVHAQPVAVVTSTEVPAPAPAETDWLVGLIEATQEPACVTENDWLAIVSVPVRALPVLAVTENATEPLPLPLAPDVIVSHASALDAVQAHPAAMFTAVELLPAVAAIDALAGANVARHEPVCVTVSVWPAIVAVPMRVFPGFDAAEIVTAPLPTPLPTPTTASQATLLMAVHEHDGVALMLTPKLPPAGVTF